MTPTRRAPGAPRQALTFAFGLALILLLAACGGGGPAPVTGCVTDPDCGGGAYCLQGTCRASAAPVADISLPAALVSAKELVFQATVTDADPGDSVARHDWTVVLVSGTCDAEPEPTTTGSLQAVFWCAGTYDVTLVATDSFGVASAPVTRRFEVSQSANLPTVTASTTTPSLGHQCVGKPLACSLFIFSIQLAAAGSDPLGQPLAYEWRARPANPRVVDATATFTPAPSATAPSVAITSPGTAMAGDWAFGVRVRNPGGYLGRSSVTVHVTNRPPVVAAAPMAVDHVFLDGAYLASGTLAAAATDPDGDPVETTLAYVEPAGSGCAATFDAATAAFSVSCTRAASLIGDVSRTASVTATDVNGDAGQADVAITIRNRPPVIRLVSDAAATEVALEHGVGACPGGAGTCFLAAGTQPFAGEDPDGDPVSEAALTTLVAAAASHSSGQVGAGTPASFRYSTSIAFPAEFRAGDGAGPFTLRGVVSDPFGATATAEVPVRVGNRPPVPRAPTPFSTADHRYDRVAREYVAVIELTAFEDPDGDPITASGDPQPGCTEFGLSPSTGALTVTCRMGYQPGASDLPPLRSFMGTRPVVATALDPWASGSATTSATIGNRPPVLVSSSGVVTATCECVCVNPVAFPASRPGALLPALMANVTAGPAACTECVVVPVSLKVDARAVDPDDDPLQLTYSTGVLSFTKTAIPAGAALSTTATSPASWNVTATDGSGGPAATATVQITEVACP